ncbi:MAG: hypothetical protein M3Y46_01700, partial [Actinomycetota bacterium]|nr:hypothetical protein [Actinomycetota bacterium]
MIELIMRANDEARHVELLAHLERRREGIRRRVFFWLLIAAYVLVGAAFGVVAFTLLVTESGPTLAAVTAAVASLV